MTDINIPEVFAPLFQPKRYKCFYGGRGSGKSHSIARALIALAFESKRRILCAREFQKSIKDSVHKLLADLIREHGLEDFFEIQESTIKGRNGSEFLFIGLKHNVTGIKSMEGIDYVWVEEAENVSDNSWELLIPTIRKEGSEIWISMNVKNVNDPTYRRFIAETHEDVIAVKVGWQDNPFFPDVLRKEKDKLRVTDFDAYQHIWEGFPDTRRNGAIYAKQLQAARDDKRIGNVPYDPSGEVFTAWDLGFGDATAIWWCQFVSRELRFIDYYENSGEQLEHYAQVVKAKPYNYMARPHYLPHDASAGNIRGLSVSQQLTQMGLKNTVLPRDVDLMNGIELLRQTLAFSAIDAEKCKEGLHALENYCYEWDEDKQIFKNRPLHNWCSHAADAARYAAAAAKAIKGGLAKESKPANVGYVQSSTQSWMGA